MVSSVNDTMYTKLYKLILDKFSAGLLYWYFFLFICLSSAHQNHMNLFWAGGSMKKNIAKDGYNSQQLNSFITIAATLARNLPINVQQRQHNHQHLSDLINYVSEGIAPNSFLLQSITVKYTHDELRKLSITQEHRSRQNSNWIPERWDHHNRRSINAHI